MTWTARNELTDRTREKVTCDICGFVYRDGDLREQRGRMVCPTDYDEPDYEDYKASEAGEAR